MLLLIVALMMRQESHVETTISQDGQEQINKGGVYSIISHLMCGWIPNPINPEHTFSIHGTRFIIVTTAHTLHQSWDNDNSREIQLWCMRTIQRVLECKPLPRPNNPL